MFNFYEQALLTLNLFCPKRRRTFEVGGLSRAAHIRVNTVKVRYIFEPTLRKCSYAIEKHKNKLQTSKEAGTWMLQTLAYFYGQILVHVYI